MMTLEQVVLWGLAAPFIVSAVVGVLFAIKVWRLPDEAPVEHEEEPPGLSSLDLQFIEGRTSANKLFRRLKRMEQAKLAEQAEELVKR